MINFKLKKWLNGSEGKFLLDIDFEIKKGEFISLYGKSGSGKTTILRLLAGFEKADSGEIIVGDKIFYKDGKILSPQKRNIGFLFQDYALFENLNVIENLLFAKNDKKSANDFLDIMELSNLKKARISDLSGGQKQRVALARALMRKPGILLLDEPLSALDAKMREFLQDYLYKIHKILNLTTIIISHDVSEIYRLCDRVFMLENGKITNIGSPRKIFLKQMGSQKLAFNAKILEITKQDSVFIAVVLVSNQLCKVVLSPKEAENLNSGDHVVLSTKAFGVNINKHI